VNKLCSPTSCLFINISLTQKRCVLRFYDDADEKVEKVIISVCSSWQLNHLFYTKIFLITGEFPDINVHYVKLFPWYAKNKRHGRYVWHVCSLHYIHYICYVHYVRTETRSSAVGATNESHHRHPETLRRELQFSQNWCDTSSWFQMISLRQGCILSSLLFAFGGKQDHRKQCCRHHVRRRRPFKNSCDLHLADDIALIANSWSSMQPITTGIVQLYFYS